MFRPYRDRSVANMPRDLRPGPDSPPTDELDSAEDTLGVLQHVLHTIAADDMSRQTPCTEFDVAQLTEHLLNSITAIGGMVDAEIPQTRRERFGGAADHRAPPGPPWTPGTAAVWTATCHSAKARCPPRAACGILSIEFLVHAWDYAVAVGHDVEAPRIPGRIRAGAGARRSSSRSSAAAPGSTTRSRYPPMPARWTSWSHSPAAIRARRSRRPHRVCVQGFECAFRARFRGRILAADAHSMQSLALYTRSR